MSEIQLKSDILEHVEQAEESAKKLKNEIHNNSDIVFDFAEAEVGEIINLLRAIRWVLKKALYR